MESFHGENSIIQANRIKELWHWFGANGGIIMDVAQAGISLYDSMSAPYYHAELGKQLPAFTVMETPEIDQKIKEELIARTLGANALPIIFPFTGSAEKNSDMHNLFRSSLQKKLWSFLVDIEEAEDFLIRTYPDYFNVEDSATRAFMLQSHIQTSLFINESVNLQMQVVGTNTKLTEGSGRKDRYVSVAMGNYLASIYDKSLLKEQEEPEDDWDIISGLFQMY
jgi:hypothetical protein